MRRFVLSLSLLAGLSAPCAAFAADTAPTPPATAPATAPAKPAMDDPNRVVCTREREVGSNRPKKVCMTIAQRDELRERARRNMDATRSGQDRGVASNGGS